MKALRPIDIVVETRVKTAARFCNHLEEKNAKSPSEIATSNVVYRGASFYISL